MTTAKPHRPTEREAEAMQRVNRAVAMAVRRSLDGYGDPPANRDATARAIGKRIQGTYGFDLRRMADNHPERTPEELYALVIVPHEFPWDTEAAIEAAGSRAGARDAARPQRYGPFLDPEDPDITPQDQVAAKVAEMRELLKPKRPPLAR